MQDAGLVAAVHGLITLMASIGPRFHAPEAAKNDARLAQACTRTRTCTGLLKASTSSHNNAGEQDQHIYTLEPLICFLFFLSSHRATVRNWRLPCRKEGTRMQLPTARARSAVNRRTRAASGRRHRREASATTASDRARREQRVITYSLAPQLRLIGRTVHAQGHAQLLSRPARGGGARDRIHDKPTNRRCTRDQQPNSTTKRRVRRVDTRTSLRHTLWSKACERAQRV